MRYHLYVRYHYRLSWEESPSAKADKLIHIQSEIAACVGCGDQVMVKDMLRNKDIPQVDILQILGLSVSEEPEDDFGCPYCHGPTDREGCYCARCEAAADDATCGVCGGSKLACNCG